MAQIKLLRIDSIEAVKTLSERGKEYQIYPRMDWDWMTSVRYSEAMKSGSVFPPIAVAKWGGRNILVDGWHRMQAAKNNKETHIKAEMLKLATLGEFYIEAVKRNSAHGKQFTSQERAKIILTLKDLKLNKYEIADLVKIPMDKLMPFAYDRMIKNAAGGNVFLKAPLKNLAGTAMSDKDISIMEYAQERLTETNQLQLLDNFIRMFEARMFDTSNAKISERLVKIGELVGGMKIHA